MSPGERTACEKTEATEGSACHAVRVHRGTSGEGARGAHKGQIGVVIKLGALATLKQVEETCRRAPAVASALITEDERLSQGNGSGERE